MVKELNNIEARDVEKVFQDLVNDYGLDYGNGEISFDNYDGPYIDATVEAPNNTIINLEITGSDYQALFNDENGNLEERLLIRGILASEIHKGIEEWDAEETFKELWTPNFEYGPFQFMEMLKSDAKFFNDIDDDLLNNEAI